MVAAIRYRTLIVEQSGTSATGYWAIVHEIDFPKVAVTLACNKQSKTCHLLKAGEPYSSIELTPTRYSVYRGDETAEYEITGTAQRH
jgi:hypothetical protein